MKESQEEVRENWLLWPQREVEIFFILENNKRFVFNVFSEERFNRQIGLW